MVASGDATVGPSPIVDGYPGRYYFSVTDGSTVGDQVLTATAAGGAITATTTIHFVTPQVTWNDSGSLAQARTGHTATLLDDGSVLVAGGYTSTGGLNRESHRSLGHRHRRALRPRQPERGRPPGR